MSTEPNSERVAVHVALVGPRDQVELAVDTLWGKTAENLKSKKYEIADGSIRRGAFSIEPAVFRAPPMVDQIFFDYLLSDETTDADMSDLVERADVVMRLPGSASNVKRALTAVGHSDIPIIDCPTEDVVDVSRRAIGSFLSLTTDEQQRSTRPADQQQTLKQYLASSAIRRALQTELGDYSEIEDIVHPALSAQVLGYEQPSGSYIWITAGLSGLGGQHDFEIITAARDSDLVLSIASQLLGAPERASDGAVLAVDGVDYVLKLDPLGAACKWNGVTVEAALHPTTKVDGFFFRGSPWVDDFRVSEGVSTDSSRIRFLRASRRGE